MKKFILFPLLFIISFLSIFLKTLNASSSLVALPLLSHISEEKKLQYILELELDFNENVWGLYTTSSATLSIFSNRIKNEIVWKDIPLKQDVYLLNGRISFLVQSQEESFEQIIAFNLSEFIMDGNKFEVKRDSICDNTQYNFKTIEKRIIGKLFNKYTKSNNTQLDRIKCKRTNNFHEPIRCRFEIYQLISSAT